MTNDTLVLGFWSLTPSARAEALNELLVQLGADRQRFVTVIGSRDAFDRCKLEGQVIPGATIASTLWSIIRPIEVLWTVREAALDGVGHFVLTLPQEIDWWVSPVPMSPQSTALFGSPSDAVASFFRGRRVNFIEAKPLLAELRVSPGVQVEVLRRFGVRVIAAPMLP